MPFVLVPLIKVIACFMADCLPPKSYESAPNSADDHSNPEELDIGPSDSMKSAEIDLYSGSEHAPAVHATSQVHLDPLSQDQDQRAISVYGYPLTPPSSQNEQFQSLQNEERTPQASNNKAKVSAAYSRPYQRTFPPTGDSPEQSIETVQPLHRHDNTSKHYEHSARVPLNASAYSPQSQHSMPLGFQPVSALPYSDSAATHLAYAAESPRRPLRPYSPSLSGSTDPQLASPLMYGSIVPPTQYPSQGSELLSSNVNYPSTPNQRDYSPERSFGHINPHFATPTSALSINHGFSATVDHHNSLQQRSSEKKNNHTRSPSATLAHAIAKHKAQRSAAGLTTDGEYYVDPKTGKHYFVANSGGKSRPGQTEKGGKESDSQGSSEKKKKERRKLYKKDSDWEVTKIKPISPSQSSPALSFSALDAPASLPMSQSASHSQSNWSVGSNSDEDRPSRWKPWASLSKAKALNQVPHAQRQQRSEAQANIKPDASWDHFEKPSQDLYGGLASETPSPSMRQLPEMKTTPAFPENAEESDFDYFNNTRQAQAQQVGYLSVNTTPGTPKTGSSLHDRTGSLYSNYSYYGDILPDGSPIRSQPNSPVTSPNDADTSGKTAPPAPSPYLAPNGDAFQPGSNPSSEQGQGTIDKAKRSNSMMLLAVNKQPNLTVPKGPGGKHDVLDLSNMDPNDPLVLLHLGIDAHERGELETSASLFEKSARQGCGLGMLMYGLALRHGWVSRLFKTSLLMKLVC